MVPCDDISVTPQILRNTVRAEIAALEVRLVRWIVATGIGVTAVVVGLRKLIG